MTSAPAFVPPGVVYPRRHFDVFISSTREDSQWSEWVAWVLRTAGYLVADSDSVMRPWADHRDSLRAAIRDAAVFIAILSPSYVVSQFANQEWQTAWQIDPHRADKRLLPFMVSPVDPPGLLAKSPLIPLFDVPEDEASRRLLAAVSELVGPPEHARPAFPGQQPSGALTPPLPEPPGSGEMFVGRLEELMRLNTILHASDDGATGRVVWVVGPKGVGKTAFVAEWLRRQREDRLMHGRAEKYRKVLWFRDPGFAETPRGMAELPSMGPVLIVFDDAEDPSRIAASARRICGDRPQTDVILVARSTENTDSREDVIQLRPLSQTEAHSLLRARLPSVNGETLQQLARLAGGLPVVLNTLAFVVKRSASTPEEYALSLERSLSGLVSAGSSGIEGLAESYLRKFAEAGSLNDAYEAEQLLRHLLDSEVEQGDDWRWAQALATLLSMRYQIASSSDDLAESIRLFRLALERVPEDHPSRPAIQANLASALQADSELTGSISDLAESLVLLRMALSNVSERDSTRPAMLSNLALALRRYSERTRTNYDPRESVRLLAEAVEGLPLGDPDRPAILSNLASATLALSGTTGSNEETDSAISLLTEALQEVPREHPDRPAILANLASALRSRAEKSASRDDVEQAVSLLMEALQAVPQEHPDQPAMMMSLANTLRVRSELTGSREDLERSQAIRAEAGRRTGKDWSAIAHEGFSDA